LKTLELLRNISYIKEKMWNKLVEGNVKVDFDSYEKVYDTYVDKFGSDDIVNRYEKVNQSLRECPLMID
jgi:hypothetical protein